MEALCFAGWIGLESSQEQTGVGYKAKENSAFSSSIPE